LVSLSSPKATKCSEHSTFSFVSHTAKIVARILRRRNLRIHVEKMNSDIEEQEYAGSDITTNCGHR
jgi:hypothetical protein